MTARVLVVALNIWILSGCAGSGQPPESAADESTTSAVVSPGAEPTAGDEDGAANNTSEANADKLKPSSEAASAEPQFTDNMSVDEATKAVPKGIERANIDQETLGKPLSDVSVYEPCKPGSNKVKIRVAIWMGKAVGIDVSSTPKNPTLNTCIRERIQGLTWAKKVKSLNTIEFQL